MSYKSSNAIRCNHSYPGLPQKWCMNLTSDPSGKCYMHRSASASATTNDRFGAVSAAPAKFLGLSHEYITGISNEEFGEVVDGYTVAALASPNVSRDEDFEAIAGKEFGKVGRLYAEDSLIEFFKYNSPIIHDALEREGYSTVKLGEDIWNSRNYASEGFLGREELLEGNLGQMLAEAAQRLGWSSVSVDDKGELYSI